MFLFGCGDAQSPPQSLRFKVIRHLNNWKKYEIGSFNASIDGNSALESDDGLNPDPSLLGIISEAYEIYKKKFKHLTSYLHNTSATYMMTSLVKQRYPSPLFLKSISFQQLLRMLMQGRSWLSLQHMKEMLRIKLAKSWIIRQNLVFCSKLDQTSI